MAPRRQDVRDARGGARLRSEGHDVVIAIVETHGRAAPPLKPKASRWFRAGPWRTAASRSMRWTWMPCSNGSRESRRRRAGAHQRPRLSQRQALDRRRGAARRGHRRDHDRERAAHRIAQRRRREVTGVVQRETVRMPWSGRPIRSRSSTWHRSSLRDRLAAGSVYPAERIDAALSNYFRPATSRRCANSPCCGSPTRSTPALQRYPHRARHRGLVASARTRRGGPHRGPRGRDAAAPRRPDRGTLRGGELLAVHVSTQDGLRASAPGALAEQRALVETLGARITRSSAMTWPPPWSISRDRSTPLSWSSG